jgi:diguanylate cyclase (GGDEF)-like protein
MARRFRDVVRSTDFVARLGGDEFMMILPQVGDLKTLLPIISSVFEACDRPAFLEGGEVRIGISMGVSFFPKDGSDLNELMKKADLSLYQSKAKKGHTFTCYSDPN